KPRFLLMPMRTLSPSSRYESLPMLNRARSSATAIVLLPLPDSPVNQIVAPFCRSRLQRSSRVTSPPCQVTLVAISSATLCLPWSCCCVVMNSAIVRRRGSRHRRAAAGLASFRETVQQEVVAFLDHIENVELRVAHDDVAPGVADADHGQRREVAVERFADDPLPDALLEHAFEELPVTAAATLELGAPRFGQVEALVVVDLERLVALAVAREVRGQRGEQLGFERLVAFRDPLHALAVLLDAVQADLAERFLFRAEVVVEAALLDAEALGDVARARAVESLFREHGSGGAD